MSYCVQLDLYSGPLDLLLYLVRRQELDVVDLSISRITNQFLVFLDVLKDLDLDEIGEFIVLASTLVEIKSRLVLPGEEDQVVAEAESFAADPRADLVKQLIQYKRFKEASKLLDEQSSEWQLRYPRLADDSPDAGTDPAQDRIREVELWDLVSALSRVLHQNTDAAPKSIVYDDTPISTYVERIRARVLEEQRVPFTSFFEGANFKSKIIGIFLAVLEILRHYQFRAEQPDEYGEIWILPPLAVPAMATETAEAVAGTKSASVEPVSVDAAVAVLQQPEVAVLEARESDHSMSEPDASAPTESSGAETACAKLTAPNLSLANLPDTSLPDANLIEVVIVEPTLVDQAIVELVTDGPKLFEPDVSGFGPGEQGCEEPSAVEPGVVESGDVAPGQAESRRVGPSLVEPCDVELTFAEPIAAEIGAVEIRPEERAEAEERPHDIPASPTMAVAETAPPQPPPTDESPPTAPASDVSPNDTIAVRQQTSPPLFGGAGGV